MRRPRRIHPDDKGFMNEILLRHERAMREVYRGFDRVGRSIDANTEDLKANTARLEANTARLEANTARLNDMGDEIRANTQAVLRLLDEFGGGSPA